MRIKYRVLSAFVTVLIAVTVIFPGQLIFADIETNAKIVNVNEYVNLRKEATTKSDVVATLPVSSRVYIIENVDAQASDTSGYSVWCHIKAEKGGTLYEGYVASHFVQKDAPTSTPSADSAFENSISTFPESYKVYLRNLHESHPNWVFIPVKANASWNDVLDKEAKNGVSLVQDNVDSSWISQSFPGVVDSPNWVNASRAIIAYYLDPRNLLSDSAVFQFLDLRSQAVEIQDESINKVLNGTFMSLPAKAEYEDKDYEYSAIFKMAAKASNINPIFLASHAIQECGTRGSTSSNGTGGVYNFFNIGAYSDVIDAARVGLDFAANGLDPVFNEKYLLPWDTQGASIIGGSMWINDNYISAGQYTLYYMRFNVAAERQHGLCVHQYMTALQSATSEAGRMCNSYKASGLIDSALTFYIPVYENMPEVACELPTSTTKYDSFIYRTYNVLLSRDPSSTEMADSRGILADCSVGRYIASIIYSVDFKELGLSDEAFVDLMYEFLLNRKADDAGKQYCLELLDNYCSRKAILALLVNSSEAKNYLGLYSVNLAEYKSDDIVDKHQDLIPLVQSLYEGFLGRKAEYDGMVNWISVLANGDKSGPQAAAAFATSKEFINMDVTNGDFVSLLYRICFNREADSEGFAYWVGLLENHYSREYVIQGFVNSPEYCAIFAGYGISTAPYEAKTIYSLIPDEEKIGNFVNRLYELALGRQADEEGFNGWKDALVNQTSTGYDVAHGFIFSPEMKQQYLTNEEFITRMYKIFLDREPDAEGFAGWVSKLENGESLETIFEGFVYSPEFVQSCVDAGFYPYSGYVVSF
ncbi:MAG: DUF4214 domain-containing protein [Clostridia bacterium]|nr:DUF4214 domain-containing protein [Clostridia bacterium]